MPLTDTGMQQAQQTGRLLKDGGYALGLTYASVLKRAEWTPWHALDELARTRLQVRQTGACTSATTARYKG